MLDDYRDHKADLNAVSSHFIAETNLLLSHINDQDDLILDLATKNIRLWDIATELANGLASVAEAATPAQPAPRKRTTARPLPSCERLHMLLSYNPQTGKLIWRQRAAPKSKGFNKYFAGKLAGCVNGEKYLMVSIDNKPYLAHRIIWKMMTGQEPILVDHRNGHRADNRWANLRMATSSQNCCNSQISPNHASGTKGVTWHPKARKWQVQITSNRKTYWFGQYAELDKAVEVATRERARLHGEFARDR